MIARSLRAQRTHFLEHVGIWHLDLLVGLSMLEIFTIEFVDRIDDAQFLPKKGNYSKLMTQLTLLLSQWNSLTELMTINFNLRKEMDDTIIHIIESVDRLDRLSHSLARLHSFTGSSIDSLAWSLNSSLAPLLAQPLTASQLTSLLNHSPFFGYGLGGRKDILLDGWTALHEAIRWRGRELLQDGSERLALKKKERNWETTIECSWGSSALRYWP